MSDSVATVDPIAAARIATLEAMLEKQQAALAAQQAALAAKHAAWEAEQAAHVATRAERDRLREAYDALTREVELARRRLVVAKAERVDTAQLELEFAATLAKLDALSRKAEAEIGEKSGDSPAGAKQPRNKSKPHGRRDLRLFDLPEEHIAIPDPLLEGKVTRIGIVDRGVAGHHLPRRRAPPEVAEAAVWCGDFAVAVIGGAGARAVPASCLCSQSR